MSDHEQRHSTKATLICLFAAIIMAVLPASVTAPARDLVRLAFVPALRLVGDFRSEADTQLEAFSSHEALRLKRENEQLERRLRESELQFRQTQLGILAAQKQILDLKQTGTSPFATGRPSPLVKPKAVQATIIGDEIVSLWKSARLLDRGSGTGLFEDQWVLDSKAPKIDHGQTTDVVDGLPVFAGRCLVGRIAKSGRWTSSLQLTSDPEFRAKAVVLLQNPGVLSSEFLLEGAGHGTCRLVSVPSSEQIEEGSLVYSVPGDRGIDAPMLFGRVTSAVIQPGSLHWEVTVTPTVDPASLDTVQVVTTTLNPDRMIGRQENPAPRTAKAQQGRERK